MGHTTSQIWRILRSIDEARELVTSRSVRNYPGSLRFWLFTVVLLLLATTSAPAQQTTQSRLERAEKEPQNWLTYYGNYNGWSYSQLNQINRSNVKQLAPVWTFAAGVPPPVTTLRVGLEAAPLVVDGLLYLVGPQNNVYAIEAATGKSVWTYIYRWPDRAVSGVKGARGLAYGDGLIYMGAQDNHLVGLDAETGKEVWNIEVKNNSECGCSLNSPPLFVRGKIIAGSSGGGGKNTGYLNAFDAKTGSRVWHFDVVPPPGQPGNDTWAGDTWRTGSGSAWYTGTYDPELNVIYWGTGDPFPVWRGDQRPGANLYTASLLAIDADTGKLKWYFQETPHDLYDYDSAMEPVLLDLDVNGQKQKLILHPSKNGFAYVYDRITGKFIRGFPYGSPNWAKGQDANGRAIDAISPADQKDFLICPNMGTGARNINHSAYSPRTGLWYTTDNELCSYLKSGLSPAPQDALNPNAPPNISAFDPTSGKKQWTFKTKYFNESSLLATAGDLIFGGDLDGNVFALDARTGQMLWSFSAGTPIAAPPVTFSINGRQYVAVSAGGGSNSEGRLPNLYPQEKNRLLQPASTLFVFSLR